MTRNPIRRTALVLLFLLLPLPAIRAEEPTLRDLLRDALYTEEVTRDPEQAAKQYENLLSRHEAQKPFAAAALFRLAEVRRKQDRKNDAIQLYQRLIAEFPNAETECKLARENLAELGGKMPTSETKFTDPEDAEISRLEKLLESSPDLVNQAELGSAVSKGRIRVTTWLIQVGKVNLAGSQILAEAAAAGHVRMIEKLMDLAGDSLKDQMPEAMDEAIGNGFLEVVRTLLKRGADPDAVLGEATFQLEQFNSNPKLYGGRPLVAALASDDLRIADLLLDSKADVKRPEGPNGVTPLFVAAGNPKAARYVEKLLDLGADPNADVKFEIAFGPEKKKYTMSPLHYAVMKGATDCAKILVKHGADLKKPDFFRLIYNQSASEDDVEFVRFFVDAGVSPDLPINDGRTILAWAVGIEKTDLIKFLLSKGANPNATISPGSDSNAKPNLVQHAGMQGHEEILKLLLDAGGNPKADPYGNGLLSHIATTNNDEKALGCIKLLVEQGVAPHKGWKESGFESAKPLTKAFLLKQFPNEETKIGKPPSN